MYADTSASGATSIDEFVSLGKTLQYFPLSPGVLGQKFCDEGVLGQRRCDEGNDCDAVISGVIAAPSSGTSIQVANLLKLFQIPQVSFFSTSAKLSSAERFPFFKRTIPSDKNQAAVMVGLLKMFNWKYVSVVYEESTYGFQAFDTLQDVLSESGICIAAFDTLMKDSGVGTAAMYDSVVEKLYEKRRARGVIVFGSDQEVGQLMKAVKRLGKTGWFSWIGSDGWGARELAFKGMETEVEGAVTVQPLAYPVQGFDEYFKSLTPENNKMNNPWFIEYWEQQFQCKYPNARYTPFNENYTRMCTGKEEYNSTYPYKVEGQLQFVSDAIYAYAQSFKNLHRDLCGGKEGICDAMDPVGGNTLLQALGAVNFTSLANTPFQFWNNQRDGPNKYRILNFRRFKNGTFKWITVGYSMNNTFTEMNETMMQFRQEDPIHPPSTCSQPCRRGQIEKKIDECCWYCAECGPLEFLVDKNTCKECPFGFIPNFFKNGCTDIRPSYLKYSDGVAIGAMVVASLGICVTVFVIVVFIIYRDTAVVKASGRELSFVLLDGILLCYTVTFLLVWKPTPTMCGIQRFIIGICFAECYSAILTKTDRISRIFRAGKRTVKRPKLISPTAQLMICFALFSVQLLVIGIWLWQMPPTPYIHYADIMNLEFLLVCKSAIGFSYAIALSYPLLLIIICTVYAILTRKIPEAFNESKYIGFTMYTTCIIWLAFIPIYLSTGNNLVIRMATLAFTISLSATVALVCMFTPKLYIIILHPERNVRQSMMASKTSSITQKYTSTSRVDSTTTRSDGEMEMSQRLKSSGSLSSGLSWSTSATQTYINGNHIATQTCDGCGYILNDQDVLL